jgi:predicted PolB exonuclease-like 3'-5' exonuclease
MLKLVPDVLWCFDVEWVPDPISGRRTYQLPQEMPDSDVMQCMWEKGGATPEDPMPYLKTALCRVVSIAAVVRTRRDDGSVHVRLTSLPHDVNDPAQTAEAEVLKRFLEAVGNNKPQLVGFNSKRADLKILVQRAVAQGLHLPEFCQRPEKRYSGEVDYFDHFGDWHIDLIDLLGSGGKSTPSLHEMATVCGIPGKLDVDGQEVAPMWLQGEWQRIVAYNECDALSTYLLWLRTAHFSGKLNSTEYSVEQEALESYLQQEAQRDKPHLQEFLQQWHYLRS